MPHLLIEEHLDRDEYEAAANLIISAATCAKAHWDSSQICKWLARLPRELFDANPDLLGLQARCLLEDERLEEAAMLLQRANLLYTAQQNFNSAAECTFELVRIYHRREDFRTALLYLREAEALLPQITDEELRPHLHLRLATLYPDVGRLREGIEQAQVAYTHFKFAGELAQQFKAVTLLSMLYRQIGEYDQAASHLTLAYSLHTTASLNVEAYAMLLNGEAHIEWYRGNLAAAMTKATALQHYTRRHPAGKFELYGAMVLANVQRSLAQYDEAIANYGEARRLAAHFQLPLFAPWIDAQEGWLHVLKGNFSQARPLIYRALETHDRGQMMSFNVYLAALNALSGYLHQADMLLRSSLEFYTRSGDELAMHEIRFQLAHVAIQQGQSPLARKYVAELFGWLDDRHIFYLPLWWHPQITASVCTFAIGERIQPLLAERMIMRHVQQAALPFLHPLLDHAAEAVREQARQLIELLDDGAAIRLDHVKDARIRQLLETLLAQGVLRRSGFKRLQERLTTAQDRRTPNHVLVAVFGLYLGGATREEIAERVGRSVDTVRNYITTLYATFDLPQSHFRNDVERRQRLVEVSKEEGFI